VANHGGGYLVGALASFCSLRYVERRAAIGTRSGKDHLTGTGG